MPATARKHPDATPNTVVEQPANDVGAPAREPTPTYTLTAERRRRCVVMALALDPSLVPDAAPPYMQDRIAWLGALQATAWRDRQRLAGLSFGEAPLTAEEIDELGYRVEFVREASVGRGVLSPTPAGGELEAMTDAELRAELDATHQTLCDALVPRFGGRKGSRERREALQKVRRDRTVKGIAPNSERLLVLCRDRAIASWLSTLPKGEGAALARLPALHAEWVRRAKVADVADPQGDLVQRAWVLAMEAVPRILTAGRYLVKGDRAREGDYRGFRPPRARAKKPATPAPAPTPVGPTG